MARKQTETQSVGILLVTANVGSLFEDFIPLHTSWLKEFYQTVETHKPLFLAMHCQEVGGKNYKESMIHLESFIEYLFTSETMREFNRARIFIDDHYDSQEHYTALGSFYFIHKSLIDIRQFDFEAKKFRKVVGKETRFVKDDNTPMVQKKKFPLDFFPEKKWSRKGYIRSRWALGDCVFDLMNIHLYHDASNLVAWEKSPSDYSDCRQNTLLYVLDRLKDPGCERAPFFMFGDFNFRLDSKEVIESLCASASIHKMRTKDTNEVYKIIFRESDNDKKVLLHLEKKLFHYINQDVFRANNGTSLLKFDKELSGLKDRLHEMDICFPPSYPYSEDSREVKQYMDTRCPAWCDRILMSPSARDLVFKSENDERSVVYNNIGANVCMGDHKPVFLSFQLTVGPSKHCVVQ